MASNKNQHFVPKCYLKPFTLDRKGVAISVYNIDRQRLIPNASTKNQCSKDYFYGQDDQLERAIQSIEQAYATVLKEILLPGYRLTAGHCEILQIFWLFQYLRTEGANRRSVDMLANMLEPVKHGDNFSISLKEAVQSAMYAFSQSMETVSDLKVCLLKNQTDFPFITSDDPAVLTNRWQLQDLRGRWRPLGLKGAGAILFLPISPQICCVGYDSDVYSVPSDKGWVAVRTRSDIEAINELQLLNCRANIFINDEIHAEVLDSFVEKLKHRRLESRYEVNFAIFDGEAVGGGEKFRVVSKVEFEEAQNGIVHAQTVCQSPSQWPSFLMRRNKGCVYHDGSAAGYVRRMHADSKGASQPFSKILAYK